MPELTDVHMALLVAVLFAGFILGWIFRGRRTTREKQSINSGWQAQIDSQQGEAERLAGQNKSLMEQISQYQASNKDAKNRAKELSDSLKEAFERRDELQRQLKDIRGNLEVAVAQRNKLQSSAVHQENKGDTWEQELAQRDARIAKLSKELKNWQERVPPLVERYRARDLEAQQLEIELQKATDELAGYENSVPSDQTRIESAAPGNLPERLDASNEPHTETSVLSASAMDDDYDDAANSDELPEEFDYQPENINETADETGAPPVDDEDSTEESSETDDDVGAMIDAEPDRDSVILAQTEPETNSAADADTESDLEPESVPEPKQEQEQEQESESDSDSEAEAEAEAETGETSAVETEPESENDEQLQRIKGIGPAIEKTLNELGISELQQIADLSEVEIDRVAQELKGFRSRIYREDWIGQARMLLQQSEPNGPQ